MPQQEHSKAELPEQAESDLQPKERFNPGEWAASTRFGVAGRIIRQAGRARVLLQSGALSYECSIGDLTAISEPKQPEPPRREQFPSRATAVRSVDLHNLPAHRALTKFERELNRALISDDCRALKIIHGIGTGYLEQCVRELLKNYEAVGVRVEDCGLLPGVTLAVFD